MTDEAAVTESDVEASTRCLTAYSFARRNGAMLEIATDDGVHLVHRADAAPSVLLEMVRAADCTPTIETVSTADFEERLTRHFEQRARPALDAVGEFSEGENLESIADALPEPEDLMESEDDAPIIRLINALLTEAVRHNASDIHIEPFEERLSVRMRVDGVMQEVLEPPRSIAALVVSRIKVMSRLDISEKRLPQDGRISLRVSGRPVDIRVSTLPSGHGERVVMRLLDKEAGRLDLAHLGMSDVDSESLDRLIHQPHGILLVTGPTGSGKTTTLYAGLTRLNDASRTILTVEDPVEYYLDGIGQTQVNTRVDLTFARGLRAILRQDPDVVMVGEIRDLETAQTAVQASLTGHLVLSTLHTNTAIGAVTRLRDMGVEPFLLSSSLVGVLAQRLVRILCTQCREPYSLSEAECRLLGIEWTNDAAACRPRGCRHCNDSGYAGRTGIYELVTINDRLSTAIHRNESEQVLTQIAREHARPMRADGARLVLAGRTSLAEVLRVTPDRGEPGDES